MRVWLRSLRRSWRIVRVIRLLLQGVLPLGVGMGWMWVAWQWRLDHWYRSDTRGPSLSLQWVVVAVPRRVRLGMANSKTEVETGNTLPQPLNALQMHRISSPLLVPGTPNSAPTILHSPSLDPLAARVVWEEETAPPLQHPLHQLSQI
jgi:hypothetical protein